MLAEGGHFGNGTMATKGHHLPQRSELLTQNVATAFHLGVTEFLTFDGNQNFLAEAEGLVVPA
jgi:hypothetical protein